MKYMIASDIHGSAYYCQKLLEAYEKEKPQKLVLLGDILYHGPRNDLPRDYDPKKVALLLSSIGKNIICVGGNCDSEVDQMVLPFPILADYALLLWHEKVIFATHSHKFSPENPPVLEGIDIFLYGHTHVPDFSSKNGVIYLNPGSVSIPKNGSKHSYIILDDDVVFKNFDN